MGGYCYQQKCLAVRRVSIMFGLILALCPTSIPGFSYAAAEVDNPAGAGALFPHPVYAKWGARYNPFSQISGHNTDLLLTRGLPSHSLALWLACRALLSPAVHLMSRSVVFARLTC